jgi:hypothetical protein
VEVWVEFLPLRVVFGNVKLPQRRAEDIARHTYTSHEVLQHLLDAFDVAKLLELFRYAFNGSCKVVIYLK